MKLYKPKFKSYKIFILSSPEQIQFLVKKKKKAKSLHEKKQRSLLATAITKIYKQNVQDTCVENGHIGEVLR
jgi:hypothetical protein